MYFELLLHFCTGVTLRCTVLHVNCSALSQSESSNFSSILLGHVIKNFSTEIGLSLLEKFLCRENSLSCERIVVLEFLEEVFSGWRLFEIVVSLCVPANTICYNCAVDNNETKITFQIFRN